MALNAKQQRFVESYLFFENATQAAKDAGYSETSAHSIGHKLLKIDEIAKAIEIAQSKKIDEIGVTKEIVLRELLRIATCDISAAYNEDGSLKPIKQIPEDVRRCIAGVETLEKFEGYGKNREKIGDIVKIKFWEKTKATEQLGRYLKLFTDKLEVDDKSSLADKLNRFKSRGKP